MTDWVALAYAKRIKDPVARVLAIRDARRGSQQASAAKLPTKARAATKPALSAPPKLTARRPRPIALGTESGDGAPFSLDFSDQANAICAVAGMSGSGKTHFLRSLAAAFVADEIPVLLFDLHGDLAVPGIERVSVNSSTGFDPVALLRQLGADSRRAIFRQLLPKIGYLQEEQLSQALEKAATLPELLKLLSASSSTSSVGLRAAIERTFSDRAFFGRGFDLSALGQRSLQLDFTALSRAAQPVAAALVLLLTFEKLRQAGPTMKAGQLRCFACLDEAKILQGAEIVDVLSREARKFGLGLAVASQSVRDLSEDVLGNASVTVCFRLNTRAEAHLVEKAVPGMDAAVLVALQAPGEALVRDRSGIHRITLHSGKARRKKA